MDESHLPMDPRSSDVEEVARSARAAGRRRRALDEIACRSLADGDLDRTLGLVSAAAEYGWFHHSGELVSNRLERLMQEVSEALGSWPETPVIPPGRTRRLLHVLTEAHPVGGHTRMAARWMENHVGVRHDVVITAQPANPPCPSWLLDTAAATGGTVTFQTGGRVQRLRDLQRRSVDYDVVVLHVHPWDAVVAAAFAHGDRSVPVALVNHADHVFWLGVRSADRILCLRETGLEAAHRLRGVPRSRIRSLPIPLPASAGDPASVGPGARGRTVMGVANPYKWDAGSTVSIPAMLEEYLDRDQACDVVVVGPSPGDATWERLRRCHPLRVTLLGHVPTPPEQLRSAAVFLDSYPMPSVTSWLEAGLVATPVLAFRPPWVAGTVLSGDAPGAGHVTVAGTPEEWLDLLAELLDNPSTAATAGAALQADIRWHHIEAWSSRLEEALDGVVAAPSSDDVVSPEPAETRAGDAVLLRSHALGHLLRPLESILAAHGVADALLRRGEAMDLGVLVAVRGTEDDVVGVLQTVLEECGPFGRLDVHCLDVGLDPSGKAVLELLRDTVTRHDPVATDGIGSVFEAVLEHTEAEIVLEVGDGAAGHVSSATVSAMLELLLRCGPEVEVVPAPGRCAEASLHLYRRSNALWGLSREIREVTPGSPRPRLS